MDGWVGKLADEVPGLSLTSGGGVGPTVYVSISASYALASYVTGFGKTLHMGFFLKIEFDAWLISSTIELQVLGR